ncbi:MAG: hypothetical protein ABSE16_09855 [Verrucomicrobiota bacterium]
MFDLETSIAEWREQMLAAGIKSPVPLEELENHLREEIERQTKSGLNAKQAFETAASNVGHASELKREFKIIAIPMNMEKVTKVAGIICVALALTGQLLTCAPIALHIALAYGPRLSFIARMLPLAGLAVTLALIPLSWKYNHKLLPAIQNQLHRRAIGFTCYAACLLWIRFGLFQLPFAPTNNMFGLSLVYCLFGTEWAVIAILGGVAYGLEKAAHRQNTLPIRKTERGIDLSATRRLKAELQTPGINLENNLVATIAF